MLRRYFRDYAPSLPILDHGTTTPNACYSQSPFLFWATINSACRFYPQNPSLLSVLSQHVSTLALLSVNTSANPICAIQGLLIVLTWPPVRDPQKPEITYSLCGLLIHRARQIGLHAPRATREFHFSNNRHIKLSEAEVLQRSELWANCLLCYQR